LGHNAGMGWSTIRCDMIIQQRSDDLSRSKRTRAVPTSATFCLMAPKDVQIALVPCDGCDHRRLCASYAEQVHSVIHDSGSVLSIHCVVDTSSA